MNLNKRNTKQIMKLIAFAALMIWVVINYKLLIDLVAFVIKLLMPLIVGISIAFVINVPMKKIETKIFKINKLKYKKLVRILSLILSILLIFGIIILIMFLVVPEVIEAVINISESIPKSYGWINDGVKKLKFLYPEIESYIKNIDVKSIVDSSVGTAGDIASILIGFLSGMISKIVVFFIGFVISIYILIDKENLSRQSKKLLSAFFGNKVTKKITQIVKLANLTFTNFLTGQLLDASLIGFLLFLILSVLKLPYALILGVLFTITALIPYVGAFITLFVGVILIGVVNPIGTLWYVIIFFALQQLDENFTYPRIVGASVGLPALWSLIAVLIGGSILGFIGMIISIPIASILYSVLKDFVNSRLKKNKEMKLDN